jgi:hypothetical protein
MTSVNVSREELDDDVRRERQAVAKIEDEVNFPSSGSFILFLPSRPHLLFFLYRLPS